MASRLRTVLGAMEFGRSNLAKEESCFSFIEAYLKAAGDNEIDTALLYTSGSSETIIRQYEKIGKELKIATKAHPKLHDKRFTAEGISAQLDISLTNLGRSHVDIFYLHAPDHKTPIEDTLRKVEDLYRVGKFKELGLSNYSAWQVADIYRICEKNGWVLPTVYQGMYNPITRAVESELIPCLRKFGIRFYAYNPLAGGLLTGRYRVEDIEKPQDGRFWTVGGSMTEMYRKRFWRESVFNGVAAVKRALDDCYGENKVSLVSAAFRWLNHHSLMDPKFNDAIIIGCSKEDHLLANIAATREGPLDDSVVKAFDDAWQLDKGNCACYFR